MQGLGLRGAHLVVGEDEVDPAALQVEAEPEALDRDARALDVPTGPAVGESRCGPRGFARAGRAPQERVEDVALAGPVGVSPAVGEDGEHLLPRPAALGAEVRRRRQVEVNVRRTGLRRIVRDELVGGTGVEQGPHPVGDVVDPLDDPDVVARRDDRQGLHVVAEELDLSLGELAPVDPVALRALQERVVDVGDILRVVDLEARVTHDALEHIEGDIRRRVPHVRRVVGRDAADVEPEGLRALAIQAHAIRALSIRALSIRGAGVRRRGGGHEGGPRGVEDRWDLAPTVRGQIGHGGVIPGSHRASLTGLAPGVRGQDPRADALTGPLRAPATGPTASPGWDADGLPRSGAGRSAAAGPRSRPA